MIKIMDLSRYEDDPATPARVNFKTALTNGISGCYFRCANGAAIDTTYSQFVTDCNGVMPWGAYGIMYPTSPMKLQAGSFVAYLKQYGIGALPIAIDWEVEGITWQMVAEYIAIVQAAFPGKEIILYSRAEYLRRMLPNIFTSPAKYYWFSKFQIWQAHYALQPENLPLGFTRCLWQYTDREPAGQYGITEAKGVDVSAFDGTLLDFEKRFSLTRMVEPVPTPIPPTYPAPTQTGLYRVRHDIERHDWNYKSRLWQPGWKKLRGLPETVRLGGGRANLTLSPAWARYVENLHCRIPGKPTPAEKKRIDYVKRLQSGWVNYGPWPRVEQLTFGGNLVEVLRIEGNKAFVRTFFNDQNPPILAANNTLVQTFSVVYTDGTVEMATPVGLVKTILIANPGENLWIDLDNLVKV